ncbi:MAG: dihydrofolate reductase [Bacilli bacterium]|nr:dihydrofolate reductase [Bacilli bacterium]
MAINIIAAIGKNNELGKNNDLIWRISEDLKFFAKKTMGHDIIMGRKTFESLPNLLKGRRHIILTRNPTIMPEVIVCDSIEEIVDRYKRKEAYVIGGASIYAQFLEYAKKMYLTEIDAECKDADVFFPQFNEEEFIKTILDEKYDNKLDLNYKHVLYKRR